MENSNRALFMAGAVLIVLIVISIAWIIVYKSGGLSNVFSKDIDEQDILDHNAQFSMYNGTIRGTQLITLISKVEANNNNSKFIITLTTPHGNIPDLDAGTIISSVDKLANYTVTNILYDSRGVINQIIIG